MTNIWEIFNIGKCSTFPGGNGSFYCVSGRLTTYSDTACASVAASTTHTSGTCVAYHGGSAKVVYSGLLTTLKPSAAPVTYVAGYKTKSEIYGSTTCSESTTSAESIYLSACTNSGTTYSQTLIDLSNFTFIFPVFDIFINLKLPAIL